MRTFRYLLSVYLVLMSGMTAWAQYEMVSFDYENGYFNNGQALPAESSFILTGNAPTGISLVEVHIYKKNANQDKPGVFDGMWKRAPGSTEGTFKVPVHTRLHGNSEYDVAITYFRPVGTGEKQQLQQGIYRSLSAYLKQSTAVQGQKVKLLKSRSVMMRDLDQLVMKSLQYYRSSNMIEFEGFSDLIRNGLENLDGSTLRTDSIMSPDMAVQLQLENLLEGMTHEVQQMINSPLVILQDVRKVEGYGTEKGRRTLALNVGYGGVILDGSNNGFAYDTSPYVGLSFPFANPNLAGPFWSKLSISLGAFTNNFTDTEGREVSGPIFGRPYFVGLGYNFFRFIRLNAGVTALETRGSSSAGGGDVSVDVEAISLQPFVGLSAEIDLWLGFREKR